MATGWHWDEAYAWHQTGAGAAFLPAEGWIQPGIDNAESALTKTRLRDLVARSGLLDALVPLPGRVATEEELLRFHSAAYLRHIEQVSAAGGGEAGDATPIGPGSYEIARRAAGGAIATVEAVVRGDVDNAYALVRPPGHHAEAELARGYCLFANTALAALHARHALDVDRVAVVDWDVHHGNGTEDAFYEDPTVLTISLHADELFPPGRGFATDDGRGAGKGANVNIPLPDGCGHEAYLAAMDRIVVPALRRFGPELIVVASGLDASAFDPLGRHILHSGTYRAMTERLLAVAAETCDGRLAMIHEGGYSEAYVPFCGVAVVEALAGVRIVVDPFLPFLEQRPGQRLAPHQEAAIARAAALVDRIPTPA
ncbi:MAG TPA: class II histone deacetylase [Capillimicrobium sp.]|jgi:acetoin utilization deacetylase AcuC-like enzyme|nr:class II histone deacetylase [Capillimicrobium sp.]